MQKVMKTGGINVSKVDTSVKDRPSSRGQLASELGKEDDVASEITRGRPPASAIGKSRPAPKQAFTEVIDDAV